MNEKKQLSESCSLTVKELTKKMNDALSSQEERHKVELKKAIDKQTASEKIKKDRWVDLKTKKIKVNINFIILFSIYTLFKGYNFYKYRR